ncbi:hypothetical protein EV424DRAFT_1350283 [Suillus variegatus]|nr:hypothetical protein EV424DRAFT_1350283 [Suillus variegatus]
MKLLTGITRFLDMILRHNGSYTSSIISQDAGPPSTASIGGSAMRRGSFSSAAGASDMASMSGYDYKSQDGTADLDDVKSRSSLFFSEPAVVMRQSRRVRECYVVRVLLAAYAVFDF